MFILTFVGLRGHNITFAFEIVGAFLANL